MNQNAILRNEINQSGMRLYDISRKTRIYESKLKRFMQDGVDIPRANLVPLGGVFPVFNQFARPDPEPNKLISSDRDGGLWCSDRVPDYDPIADMEKRVDMYYRVLQFLETDKISTRQRDVAKMFLCPLVIFAASKRLGLIVTKNQIRTWVGGTVTREMARNVLNRSIRLAADNRENRNR